MINMDERCFHRMTDERARVCMCTWKAEFRTLVGVAHFLNLNLFAGFGEMLATVLMGVGAPFTQFMLCCLNKVPERWSN